MSDSTTSTSERPTVITRYAEAWQTGDLVGLIECYHPDIVAHYGGTSPYAGRHVGRDAFLHVLATTAALGDRQLVSVDQIHDEPDCGALFVTESFGTGDEKVVVDRALRYRVENDLIIECWLFESNQHVVDALWSDG